MNRLWHRQDNRQRELLLRLSVYPESAPSQYWPDEYGELFDQSAQQLLALRLVEQQAVGEVGLLPALQEWIYNEKLTPDLRELYHLDAAERLIPLAEYTEGAYHLDKGGDSAQAIQLWYPVMESEIQQGKSGVAYSIFVNMVQRNLPSTEQRALAEIQAHLHELYGDLQAGLGSIQAVDLGPASEQRARLLIQKGRFEDALGYPYLAQESYRLSVSTTASIMAQTVNAYHGHGMVHVRQRELASAQEIAFKMEQELLILRGILAEEAGEFNRAYTVYNEALALSQKLDDLKQIATCYRKLSGIQTFRGLYEDAIWYAEQAKRSYEQIGDRLGVAQLDNTLAGIHLETQNYAEAIRVGERATRFFLASKYTYFASTTLNNVAEAYFYEGNHERATEIANQILDYEEPHAAPNAYYTLGLIREAEGEFPGAILYFERSLEIAESTGNSFMQAFARRAYGKMLCLDNQPLEGREQLSRALAQFKTMEKTQEVVETEKLLARYGAF